MRLLIQKETWGNFKERSIMLTPTSFKMLQNLNVSKIFWYNNYHQEETIKNYLMT